jgi:RNA polymerase sigma factor (sigma-70 family)
MPLSDEELAAAFLSPSRLRTLTDEDLMAALRMGCNDALAVLFERHSALVFRIARAILHDDGEAEETVKKLFLDIFRGVNQFNPDRGNFKTWLLQYAYHRSIDRRQHLPANRFYKKCCWTIPAPVRRRQGRALTGKRLLGHESSAGVS